MTSQWVDNQARKDRILGLTIAKYINSVSPVSSRSILTDSHLGLSSATIRNILAILEEEGYLTHPHTSAGRVPTQKGYRYYVDNLMDEIQLLEEEKVRIQEEYRIEKLELEELLEKTSRVISNMTHYTSIISVDDHPNQFYCQGTGFVVGYPDYNDINKIRSILQALDQKERLLEIINQNLEKKIDIFIGREMECSDIQSCSLVVSQYKSKKGLSGRIAILGPIRMNYKRVVSALDYFSDLMEEIL
jgi:transcriptional regulator of heat shock response